MIRRVSKSVSGFFLPKPLFANGFIHLLTKKLYGNAIITVKTIFDFMVSQTLVGFGTELKNGSVNISVFKLSYGRRTVQPFVICASVYAESSAKSGD